nr:MAG TPA: hypothetical protein [Caudoviricetes sp.]
MGRIHHYNICEGQYAYVVFPRKSSIKNALPIPEEPLISTSQQNFERHKIINSSVMCQTFLRLFFVI